MLFAKGLKEEYNENLLHNWIRHKNNYKERKTLETLN